MGLIASAIWDVLAAAFGSLWGRLFPPRTSADQKAKDLNDTVTALNAEAKAAANAPTDQESLVNTLKNHKICLMAAFCLSLASCASPIATACPQPRIWTNSQQDEIAANFATLPSDSPLIGVGIEWSRLRAESKACLGSKSGA